MKKRRLALVFLALVGACALATLAVLRTRWAGDRICALAAARASDATGLPVAVAACRIDPLRLELAVEGLTIGPPAAPAFTAESATARLAPVQGLGRRLELAELTVVRPRLVLRVEGGGPALRCPPEALDRLDVARLKVTEAAAVVDLPEGARVTVEGLAVDARRGEGSRWHLGPARRRLAVAAAAPAVEVSAAGHHWRVERPALEAVVALDLSSLELARAEASVGGARLGARGTVRDLCAPLLDLALSADGPLSALVGLAGVSSAPWEGDLAVTAAVTGRATAPELAGTVQFDHLRAPPVTPGAGHGRWRLARERDRVEVEELVLPFAGGSLSATGSVKLAAGAPLDLQVKLADVQLAELLERVAVKGSWVEVKLDGTGRLSGPVWPTHLTGQVDAEAKDFRSLAGPWRAAHPGDFAFLEFARGRLSAPFTVDVDGIYFHQARIQVGQGSAEVDADVHFSTARGFDVRATADADLGALRHVARLPWAGRAQLGLHVWAAPYANPRAEGHVRADQFRFLDLDLGAASADLSYGPGYSLRFTGIEGRRGQSRYQGEATVDLGATPVRVTASHFTARGRLRDLFDAVLDWLPKTRVLRDAMDGEVISVEATATGRAAALDADFQGELGAGTLLGRAFQRGWLSGHISAGEVARFDRLQLQFGPGTASLTGTWGLSAPYPWTLDASLAGVPVAALDLPGGGWAGSVSGTGSLQGDWERPDVHFGINADAVAIHGVALGTVQLGGTVVGRKLLVTGGAEGLQLAGEARLEGRLPFHGRVELSLADAARLWPGGPPAGLRGVVEGTAEAEGELGAPGDARGHVRLERVSGGYADLKLESAGPVALAFDHGQLTVERLAIQGVNTEFSLEGRVGPVGALDLTAAGGLDLRLLSAVVPSLKRPHGRLAIEAHVGGSADEPELLGDGRLEEAGFQLRGGQAAFEGVRGELAFSQNKILVDDLSGTLNGGHVGVSGEVELHRFLPARLRLEAQLDEVPVAVPASLPAVLSGRLEATGTPEETLLTGRLHVLRARYTENVDLERQLRRRATPPRPYDKAGEWLRFDLQVLVDGDARVENDLVRGGVRGELTLTGSLAAPGLIGSLAMTEGSRSTYRGNEFALGHAVVDFTDRNRIELALDVHGESRVTDYQVFMHLFGPIADPQLTLTSTPPLSQPDLITLLSMGFTRRDAPQAAGQQGLATAAAAQALFAASGLDEQVRRFLPRGGPLRDVSVRITSVYSEVSGLVEPRAEFESWVVKDRLRLRFQAPLSGARGQRAQAELRLGDHTALQYQFDTDNPDALSGDHGLDLKLRWEWTE